MYSEPEKVVRQAIQFLVTARSGLGIPAKLPVGLLAHAIFVYSAMQVSLASAPNGFYGLLTSLETPGRVGRYRITSVSFSMSRKRARMLAVQHSAT
jgi:hypothetical protein